MKTKQQNIYSVNIKAKSVCCISRKRRKFITNITLTVVSFSINITVFSIVSLAELFSKNLTFHHLCCLFSYITLKVKHFHLSKVTSWKVQANVSVYPLWFVQFRIQDLFIFLLLVWKLQSNTWLLTKREMSRWDYGNVNKI